MIDRKLLNRIGCGAGALVVAALSLPASEAMAASNDDIEARIAALEKENAAIRKENAMLRTNKALRVENATLKASQPQPAPSVAVPSAKPDAVPVSARPDPFAAYAADLPVAYKAAPEQHGQFRVWAEGGALWSGGDPVAQDYSLTDFRTVIPGIPFPVSGATVPGSFDLTPKVGWEAATGFDYRIAGSLWHVSGQFRYGESKANGLASSSGSVDPLALALAGPPTFLSSGGTQSFSADYKERRWIADIAVGRDIAGSGPDAMQIKGGLRIAELVNNLDTTDTVHFGSTTVPIVLIPGLPAVSSFTTDDVTTINLRNSFLGAGPRIGVEGSVPFAGRWTFDYQGDAAVLFGAERSVRNFTSNTVFTPTIIAATNIAMINTTEQQFAAMLNGDIQVGIGYWVTPYLKVTGSYRLDAFVHIANEGGAAANNLLPDRYVHGPRLTVTGQF